jgi:hypothetical protein
MNDDELVYALTGSTRESGGTVPTIAGLMLFGTLPLFESDREKDSFTVTLLVHHLLGPEDLEWLAHFHDYSLNEEEARALLVAREVGAINNAAYREKESRPESIPTPPHPAHTTTRVCVVRSGTPRTCGTCGLPLLPWPSACAIHCVGQPSDSLAA